MTLSWELPARLRATTLLAASARDDSSCKRQLGRMLGRVFVHQSIAFASICPKCRNQQAQRGLSRAALGRLLNAGHPIEAYCVGCDDFWSISSQERHALAERLTQRVH